jgi:GTP-binding protein HflX
MEDATVERPCILVAIATQRTAAQAETDLDELALLCETAGLTPVERYVQIRPRPDGGTFVGQGKAKELAERSEALGGAAIVCDDELSPAQIANLSELIPAGVRDRSGIILDIFAGRARTSEGKLQVELARLNYELPRLTGHGSEMSRLGGGAAGALSSRGPGETQLEYNRRHIRRRIAELRRELAEVKRHRQLLRDRRRDGGLPQVSLVGYTNAGKSTLLNALTGADVPAQDKLFATLDPTTRRLGLPGNRQALLTDTVGFIRKLPHQLVAAFRATLEEVLAADLLLHVVDASHPEQEQQTAAVLAVLSELGAAEKPLLVVHNKADRLSPEARDLLRRPGDAPSVVVSALTGEGLDELRAAIVTALGSVRQSVRFVLPYARLDLLATIRRQGLVLSEDYGSDGIIVQAELDAAWINRINQQLISNVEGAAPDDVHA